MQEEMEEEEGEVDYGSIGEHLDLWMYRQLSDRVTYNRTPHAHVRVNTWIRVSERQSTERERAIQERQREKER